MKNNYAIDNKYLAVITENGLWIKDETNKVIKIINSLKLEKNYLIDVEITEFNKDFELLRKIDAKKNRYFKH